MTKKYRKKIADEFRDCVYKTIDRVKENPHTYRPFHTALLSEEVIFWSSFERSFSTSFGQRVIERLAKLVALSNGAEDVEKQRKTTIYIDEAYERAIHNHMQGLRTDRSNAMPWNDVIQRIRSAKPTGRTMGIRVISDLWWRKDGINNYVSLKTVMPNIDQTAVAKEDCLHLTIDDPSCNAYFGLPYNPYGETRESYAFKPPMYIFDFKHDPVVLIGRELWDTIGGYGCYDELLDIASQVGTETRDAIKRMI